MKNWDTFLLAVMCVSIMPLLPLIFEHQQTASHIVKSEDMALALSMYAVAVGVTSYRRSVFGFGLLIGLYFAMVYGDVFGAPTPESSAPSREAFLQRSAVIGIFFVLNVLDLFYRHVQRRTPFPEWVP